MSFTVTFQHKRKPNIKNLSLVTKSVFVRKHDFFYRSLFLLEKIVPFMEYQKSKAGSEM